MRMLAVLAAVLLGLGSAGFGASPAMAHGATTKPMSRAAACGELGTPDSAVCRAARAASGGQETDWSNLRLADVNGRDREVVPDGKLCSAGKPEFAGLDLVRSDWPVTSLKAGVQLTFSYGQTIPHQGTFRVYLTKAGYDPSRPLRWADLATKPFASVTDPPMKGDAYTFTATVPNRAGRHMIYTIWQNSSTPDTYYSCSDVLITAAAGPQAPAAGARPDQNAPPAAGGPADALGGSPTAQPPAAQPPAAQPPAEVPGLARAAQRVTTERSLTVPLLVGSMFAALTMAGVVLVIARRRDRRPRGRHGAA